MRSVSFPQKPRKIKRLLQTVDVRASTLDMFSGDRMAKPFCVRNARAAAGTPAFDRCHVRASVLLVFFRGRIAKPFCVRNAHAAPGTPALDRFILATLPMRQHVASFELCITICVRALKWDTQTCHFMFGVCKDIMAILTQKRWAVEDFPD